jgi:hypothetical protein
VTEAERSQRAVVHLLGRSGPLPVSRVATVLARADVALTPEQVDRLVAAGHVVRVQGPDGATLLALPATAPRVGWRRVHDLPAPVLVAITLAVLVVVVLVVMALNSHDASWPAIEWGPPPD